ncbi:MAG: hypothetical protein GWP14_01565 [Actinobacteria bacterium]|nr:hypothetical protein [Actinomycetota bacterium]
MKSRIVLGTMVGCVCVLAASSAWAGPAVRSDVPAAAKWVVHFDFEAITDSEIGERAMELITAENSIVPQAKAEKAEEIWSKLKDVKSVTFYGSTFDKTDTVVIARLDYDKAEIMEMLGVQSYGEHKIHSMAAKGRKCLVKARQGFVCLYDDTTIVASRNQDRLEQALDLLDGQGRSLGPNQALGNMLQADKGSFVVAAVQDLNTIMETLQEKMVKKGQQHVTLLKKCESLRLEFGEADGEMVVKLDATLVSAEDAVTAGQAAQGMLALGMLQMGEDQRMLRLLQAVKIEQQDNKLAIQAQAPVEDIMSKMRAKLLAKVADTAEHKKAD